MFCPKLNKATLANWQRKSRKQKQEHINRRAKKEMVDCQNTSDVVFSRAACKRICKDMLDDLNRYDMHFTRRAYDALAEAAQQAQTTFFEDCQRLADLTKHKTIMLKHVNHVKGEWARQDARVQTAR